MVSRTKKNVSRTIEKMYRNHQIECNTYLKDTESQGSVDYTKILLRR